MVIHLSIFRAFDTLFCFGLAFDFPAWGFLRKYIYLQTQRLYCSDLSETLFGQRRGRTKHICSGPALAGVQESAGSEHQHICVLAIPLFLDPSSWLCFPKPPGTGTSPGGDHYRRGSQEDRKCRMVTWKVHGRVGEELSMGGQWCN